MTLRFNRLTNELRATMLGRTMLTFFGALVHLNTAYSRGQPQKRSSGTNSKPVPVMEHHCRDRLIRYSGATDLPFGALLFRRRQLLFHRSHRGNPNIQRRMYALRAQLRWGMASICRTTGIWAVDFGPYQDYSAWRQPSQLPCFL